jgi:hypothetical protein
MILYDREEVALMKAQTEREPTSIFARYFRLLIRNGPPDG